MNKKGFTLVELMISMFIFAIVMLGLIAGTTLVKKISLRNMLRNAAVNIASEEANRIRGMNFGSVSDVCSNTCDPASANPDCIVRKRFRNFNNNFGRSIDVSIGSNPDIKEVSIEICWKAYDKSYSYTTETIIKDVD